MRAVGIFRGFPGLGRVVAGLDILQQLQKSLGFEVTVFTYLQGSELCGYYNFQFNTIQDQNDISSIGIIPVSKSGEAIISFIETCDPEFVLIDGEPLLLSAIKLARPHLTVVSLLNPFDIENSNNQKSSQLFFKDCYSKADISIVHGLWKVKKPECFSNSFYSINTIIRHELNELIPQRDEQRVSCILGGGTVNAGEHFFKSTVQICEHIISLANNNPEYRFDLYCGSQVIHRAIHQLSSTPTNIRLYNQIQKPSTIYNTSMAVISRGGRNTISELLTLNLPAIVFSTNCNVRGHEQKANISFAEQISSNIKGVGIESDSSIIQRRFSEVLQSDTKTSIWNCGNNDVFEIFKKELACL